MPIATSHKAQISEKILLALAGVSEILYKSFDKIKLASGDFQETELPGVQIIDVSETSLHEGRRAEKTWNLIVECVIGPKTLSGGDTYVPTQPDLWNLMQAVERALFVDPKLGLSFMKQLNLLGSSTDLHFMEPLYVGRIEVAAVYYQPLVDNC